MSTYTIVFSQRTTLATAFSPGAEKTRFFLKARASNGKTVQHIGYADVVAPDHIVVSTVNGIRVGIAATKRQAAQMIDAYHRTHNLAAYWLWADKTLLVRGKSVVS